MIKNYFIITFRNILRNKTFNFLNISGLAVGIASAALIFLWVEDELNYNHYFPNRNNLYVIKDKQTYDGNTFVFDATPGPLAQAVKDETPGIQTTARSTWANPMLFSLEDKSIYENGRHVDSGFLTMFSVPFIKGNAAAAFMQLHSVVISEKMALKFFTSTDNIIGKTLKVDNKEDYIISGVFKDLPENVSIKFDWLISFKVFEEQNLWLKEWGSNSIITYARTDPNANIPAINKRLYDIVQRKNSQSTVAKMMLYPFNRIRLYNNFDNDGNEKEGVIKNVRLFSLIAWIILIIACINFMNLATARSEKRAKEVGIRKVMGAVKQKLIVQFIAESVLLSFLAMLLAIGIMFLILPAFNTLVHKNLSLQVFQPIHLGGLIVIALVCGILAGSYPAFYLSSFNPALVLKSTKLKTGSAAFIRKALVVTQFSASVVLIICTIIIYQQIQYGKEKDLGFKKDNLIITSLHGNMRSHFSSIKNDLINTGVVENASISNSDVLNMGSNTGDFSWEGKAPDKQILITVEGISSEYILTQGMQLKQGRSFYENLKADSNNIIINETLAKIINNKNILGSVINREKDKYTVVGVVKDFVSNNVYQPAAPLMLFADTSNANVLSVRLKANAPITSALAKVEKVIKTNNPGYPFEYEFADEEFGRFFQAETLIGKLAGVFAALAIIISCLGLFGLASFTAERRTKEIGIRKVLGASVSGITGLLSKDFLKPVLLSVVIAFPVSWWMMFNWLKDYQYKITIQWWVFALAGLLVLLIALVTVSFQSVRAAIANPVKSLRTE
ncbi:MAG: ABC transporter permease [Bacteroidota bacterium]|nr:ABC transporter permease [Bacteroidota bacterium]